MTNHRQATRYRLKRSHLILEVTEPLRIPKAQAGNAFSSIAIEGRDAPTRMVTSGNQSKLDEGVTLRRTAYRTIAMSDLGAETGLTPRKRRLSVWRLGSIDRKR